MKIDHIGIAVHNLEEAISTYESLLGVACRKREIVGGENVETAFFDAGEPNVELLGGTTPGSVISRFLAKHGEGVHHIAFQTDHLEEEVKRLKKDGFEILNETPKTGADGKRIVFLHPKKNHGVLVEICESGKDE